MTQARQLAKLEAKVDSLNRRLSARTTQLLLVLSQIADLKVRLDELGLEVDFNISPYVEDSDEP